MSAAREDGFTLVEMLVSLTLLAMAGVLLAEGFASGRGVWARVEAHTVAGQDVSAAQGLLRSRIEQLHPATRYVGAAPVVDLDGGADHLDFLSPPVGSGGLGEVRRQHLDLTPKGELELASTGLRASAPEPAHDHILLRHVSRLDLGYFGAATPDGARAWRSAWTQAGTPPELVRVRVGFALGDRRTWPELIVRPGATVDSQCVLDPSNGGCRGRG
jgi:general secretion pathway protein J